MTGQVTPGSRNNALYKLGISQLGKGKTPEQIEEGLLKFNRQYCRPPLPDDEVKGVARAVCGEGSV